MKRVNPENTAKTTFNKAKSVYSTGAPRTKARPKPEWNPYKTTNDAYGRLTAGQQEKRREMFKSKNNILLSPEAKAKDIKEKKKKRAVTAAKKKKAAALKVAKDVENVESPHSPAATTVAVPSVTPAAVVAPSPATPDAAATLLSLRRVDGDQNSPLSQRVSALSISETLKNYETTLVNLEKRVESLPTKAKVPVLVKENDKVSEIMESVTNPPAAIDPTASVEGVNTTTDLLMKLAKLEAVCNNQREYIASHIAPVNNSSALPAPSVTSSRTPPTPPLPPSLAIMPPPTTTIRTNPTNPLSSILGFENNTGYISNVEVMTGPIPLETNAQVYADIKRAKEHAEYLAGVKAREWGYQGGVGELEEDSDGEMGGGNMTNTTNENDISSMPMRSSPQPQPRPMHPFKNQQKVSFSPNVADDPESTIARKVVTRVGSGADWGAPVC